MLPVLLSLVVCQTPAPAPTSSGRSVVMDVSVVDKKGKAIAGLTAADFVVAEDDRPVRVTGVASGITETPGGSADGRIAVLFLDDATPSQAGEERQFKEVASQFVDKLGPMDVAGVIFAANPSGVQSLTTDRAALKAAIARFKQRVGQWSTSSSDTGGRLTRGGFDRFDAGSVALYRTTLQALLRLIGRLDVVENRRKAIVMISSGVPFTPPEPRKIATDDPTGTADAVLEDMRAVIRAAQRAKVTIYTVDPGGLRLSTQPFDEVASLTAEAPAPRVNAAGQANHAFLRSLSVNTGGFATVNTNNTSAAATAVLSDLAGYYMVTFESAQSGDGFRSVTIRVNRPGVTVRARPGYWPR
jgi:VWFA-related protein